MNNRKIAIADFNICIRSRHTTLQCDAQDTVAHNENQVLCRNDQARTLNLFSVHFGLALAVAS